MLQMTAHAASFLAEARSLQRIPEHYGIRVFNAARMNGQRTVQISFSERPLHGDQVNETHGTCLFVAPEITYASGDLVLDTEEDGAQLVLRETDD